MDIKDFDEWAALAKTDPEAFEQRRQAAIDDFIGTAPEEYRQRLRGLQFRVDMERARASNPLSATIRISNMMWSAFGEMREALNRAANGPEVRPAGPQDLHQAQILPFSPRKV
jgi:hypothetical protein